jgi:hypothetical protein
MKSSILPLKLSKTDQITPKWFWTVVATVQWFCYGYCGFVFVFFIYFG